MQCDEDSHCSGLREVLPCAADCASTWTAMCSTERGQSSDANSSSSSSSTAEALTEYDLVSHCMKDKAPFQTFSENDYVCLRTSQVRKARFL